MPNRAFATVYSMGFHKPKPLHRLIIKNWAATSCLDYRFYTCFADQWRALLPDDCTNIEFVQLSIEEFFARAFDFFGATDAADFTQRFGWLFSPHFTMHGYLGAQLRPLLAMIDPQPPRKLWGWSDNDVFVNPAVLQDHLNDTNAELVLFPKQGLIWEQFKLFSPGLDITGIYRELVDIHIANKTPPGAPLEAKIIYHICDTKTFRRDALEQAKIAIHWAYSDRIGKLDNQYDVALSRDQSLHGADGQVPMFFNADTQTKYFSESEVKDVETVLEREGRYLFVFKPQLT